MCKFLKSVATLSNLKLDVLACVRRVTFAARKARSWGRGIRRMFLFNLLAFELIPLWVLENFILFSPNCKSFSSCCCLLHSCIISVSRLNKLLKGGFRIGTKGVRCTAALQKCPLILKIQLGRHPPPSPPSPPPHFLGTDILIHCQTRCTTPQGFISKAPSRSFISINPVVKCTWKILGEKAYGYLPWSSVWSWSRCCQIAMSSRGNFGTGFKNQARGGGSYSYKALAIVANFLICLKLRRTFPLSDSCPPALEFNWDTIPKSQQHCLY